MTDAASTDAQDLPTPLLDAIEARVLGCLIEKEATTPEQYPLTANAVQVACNQKTARDPVLELEPGSVGHVLRTLEEKRLVRSIHGSRAQRYDHRTDDVYAISPEQRVLLALLMLRGPQTVGELLARSERLHRYDGSEQVRGILERLCTRRPALVVPLARASGQREGRYAHRLCGEPDEAVGAIETPALAGHGRPESGDALSSRVERLEAELVLLREELDQLRSRLC